MSEPTELKPCLFCGKPPETMIGERYGLHAKCPTGCTGHWMRVATWNTRVDAERAAMRAQLRLPEDYCLACGGTGGHHEGCNGTTGLIALTAELRKVEGERDEARHQVSVLRSQQALGDTEFFGLMKNYEKVISERDTALAQLAQMQKELEHSKKTARAQLSPQQSKNQNNQ